MKKITSAVLALLLAAGTSLSSLAATMYAADGRIISVPDSDVYAYSQVGWYTEPVMTVYALDGRELVIPIAQLSAYESVGWYRSLPKVILYAADGRTLEVEQNRVAAHLAVGWYTEPVTTVYALDGRTLVIPVSQTALYESVGWYKTLPKVTLYSMDGRTIEVEAKDVNAYLAVGWYKEPFVKIFALDGRELLVPESQLGEWLAVGWYKMPIQNSYGTELTSEQIYSKCSSAVFYIEIYNAAGYAVSSGSGFFIDGNGTAVTNYHVIDEAATAKIQLADSGAIYDITGIYDYDKTNDWAVIKVNCSGNSYLTVGSPETVTGGSKIYTIGSPQGLQNTISDGIISNTARVEDGVTYIQITAPISSGSSGGALINKYGEVIGITSAQYTNGQNLNFAIPMSALSGFSTSKLISLREFNNYGYGQNTPSYGNTKPPYGNPAPSYDYYTKFYGIPDFGKITGATLNDTASTATAYGYYYGLDFDSDKLYTYSDALESCGYEYYSKYVDDYGYSHIIFKNPSTRYTVVIGLVRGGEFLVMITWN